MAGKYMSIKKMGQIVDQVFDREEPVSDDLYSVYKSLYKLSLSNHFRGATADHMKNYISTGPLNCVNGLLNIANEITMITQVVTAAFNSYETSKHGVISIDALDDLKRRTQSKKSTLESIQQELQSTLNDASQYITTTALKIDSVYDAFENVKTELDTINTDVSTLDSDGLKLVNELHDRCTNLQSMITGIRDFCYQNDKIDFSNTAALSKQPFFYTEGNLGLQVKMAEDPFEYVAGEVSVSEDQWRAGLCSDIYAYAGYKWLTASGEAGLDSGKYYAKGAACVLAANAYFQITDYLRAKGDVKVAYAEGEANVGISDSFVGMNLEGEVGLFKADGSITLGTDDFNGYIKGEVKVLTAEGSVACSWEEGGEVKLGFKGEATAADASGKAGLSFFNYKHKENAAMQAGDKPLLGIYAKVDAGVSAKANAWFETETAIEFDAVNINTATINLGLTPLVGGEVQVTVPYIHFNKPPWEWW